MKILVTGAGGFIGRKLVKFLGPHAEIITHRFDEDGDIVDIGNKHLEGVDIVYHLASTTHNYHILEEDETFLDVNTNCHGTIALLNAILSYSPKAKLVYVSTFFVNNGEPLGLYGATKLCAEHICKAYARVHNINVSIARLSNVYGPGDYTNSHMRSAFVRMISLACAGDVIKLYDNGKIYRDYIFIDDVLSALDAIAVGGKKGEVYEVGTGHSYQMKRLVETIIDCAGSGSIEPIEAPEFHKQVGMGDYHTDITKLEGIGWRPQESVCGGIRKTVEWTRGLK